MNFSTPTDTPALNHAKSVATLALAGLLGAVTVACGGSASGSSALSGSGSTDCATYDGPNPTVDEFMSMNEEKTAKESSILAQANMPNLNDEQNQMVTDGLRHNLDLILPRIPADSVAKYSEMFCESASKIGPIVSDQARDGLRKALSPEQLEAGNQLHALDEQYPALRALDALSGCAVGIELGVPLGPDHVPIANEQLKAFTIEAYRLFCPQQVKP